jgi:hypothetical protein
VSPANITKQRENTIYFWSQQKNMLPVTPKEPERIVFAALKVPNIT